MFNCAAFNWICSPSVTERTPHPLPISEQTDSGKVETVVLDWLAKALGLPEVFLSTGHGGGVIQGSASEAVAVVVVAARDRYLSTLPPATADAARGKLLVFGSDQTHSCTQKAAMIAGVKFRAIPAERGTWSLSGKRVREEIERAKEEGFLPFFLTATFGTTPTCAIDDLEGIAEVGKDHPEIWMHVDAAVPTLPEKLELRCSMLDRP
jgi:aromatic-L-amino-acid decarboxylase